MAFERATPWEHMTDATKEQREAAQLERFMRDYHLATGSAFADRPARRGGDPPDFVVEQEGKDVGVEVTHLVYAERVVAWQATRALKQALLSTPVNRFDHLRGSCVYLKIDSEAGLPAPGPRGVKEILRALDRFRPVPNDISQPTDQLPPGIVQLIGRVGMMAVPLSQRESGLLARSRGFDIALATQTDVWESQAWETLADRVAKKDRNGSDLAVVSCGAPVTGGYSFPSDDLAGEALEVAAETRALPTTRHLGVVYVHTWASERIIEIRPGQAGCQVISTSEIA